MFYPNDTNIREHIKPVLLSLTFRSIEYINLPLSTFGFIIIFTNI